VVAGAVSDYLLLFRLSPLSPLLLLLPLLPLLSLLLQPKVDFPSPASLCNLFALDVAPKINPWSVFQIPPPKTYLKAIDLFFPSLRVSWRRCGRQ
jgi:hypothetical protein